jgi:putative DNA modification/repair radical SAM protein
VDSLARKLTILADSAKYDASCASTKAVRNPAAAPGICHSYTPDGRCVSLLKVLLTNYCIYDCAYCVNRVSNDLPRARFDVDEVVRLTVDFYQRNYVDGLFLSSGVIQSPDYTMERVVAIARTLRVDHGFVGYIHLKAMPGVSARLLQEAGRWSDRLSVNIELPTPADLQRFAPDKSHDIIETAMSEIKTGIAAASVSSFAPSGQTTQMIIGASATDDREILTKADSLYRRHGLRRVYYSAYSPIPGQESSLTGTPTPLVREHRLYQADHLLRQYGFTLNDIVGAPYLDLRIDPKLAWALRQPSRWPVDVNAAAREELLRVPGFGRRTVQRILKARRHTRLTLKDLARMGARVRVARYFVLAAGHRLSGDVSRLDPRMFTPPPQQLGLPLQDAEYG